MRNVIYATQGQYLRKGRNIALVVYLADGESPESWDTITASEKERLEAEWAAEPLPVPDDPNTAMRQKAEAYDILMGGGA